MALHGKLEYYTDIMRTLFLELMEQYVVAKNPKLMLRRCVRRRHSQWRRGHRGSWSAGRRDGRARSGQQVVFAGHLAAPLSQLSVGWGAGAWS